MDLFPMAHTPSTKLCLQNFLQTTIYAASSSKIDTWTDYIFIEVQLELRPNLARTLRTHIKMLLDYLKLVMNFHILDYMLSKPDQWVDQIVTPTKYIQEGGL